MDTSDCFEDYPISTVLFSNLVSLGIYGFGLFILYRVGWLFVGAYLLFILAFEFRLVRYHCTRCFYWGRICGFGRGKLSAWLFKRGDVLKFCKNSITWKDLIPDMLVTLIPLLTGVVLVITDFNLILLLVLLMLVFLAFQGNAYVRGKLVCKYCKQKGIGCPADQFFNKK